MKRFALTLPVVASALFCLPAWAAETAPTRELQKDLAGKHLAIMLASVLLPVLVKFFGSETLHLPYWAAKLRVAVVIGLGGLATVVDQIQNGGELWSAVTAAIVTTVPALLIEFLQKFDGGSEVVGQTAKSVRPPMFPLAVLIMMVAVGCAAVPYACPVLKLASTLCDSIVIELPDGTQEKVPKSAIVGMAMSARAARVAGAAKPGDAGTVDAGADR